ncbi:MAG: TonB-dependent receptor plug domain-containing protein [Opitutus sp.]
MNIARSLVVTAALSVIPHFAQGQATPVPSNASNEETIVLNPFVVKADSDEGYISNSATAAGRIAQQLENVPQKIAIYNAAFLADIKLTSFQDALRYDSGTNFSNSQFNGAAGIIRGFAAPNPLRNGVGGLATAQGNPLGVEAIEQVEIVKGAAAVLYGPSQPGGVVNYVTKRPQFRRQSVLDAQLFGHGGYKVSLDTTGPVPLKASDGRDVLAYRVVAVHEDRNLYQINDQYLKRDLFYGAVTYTPFKALTIDANFEIDHQESSFFNSSLNPQAVVTGLANGSIPADQAPLPYSTFPGGASWTYQDKYGYINQKDKFAQISAVLSHDFGNLGVWALRGHYTWSETSLDRVLVDIQGGNFPQPVTLGNIGRTVNFNQAVSAADVAAGRMWIPARYVRRLVGYPFSALNTQWDLTGKFSTGSLKHTFLVGTDADLGTNVKSGIPGVSGYEKQAYTGAAGQVNAIWVDTPDLRPISNINWDDVRNSSTNPAGVVTTFFNSSSGKRSDLNNNTRFGLPWLTIPRGGNYDKNIYFFDAISMLDDKLQLSGGARYDSIGQYLAPTQYTASQWTYRYGAVYKFTPDLSIFAIHNESFLPNSVTASAAFGYFIEPQKGKQDEVGIRYSLLNKRLLLSASSYKITTTNVVQNNPFGNVGVVPPIPSNNFAFVPGISNRGFDLDATINLSPGSQILLSYAHYDMTNAAGPAQIAQGIKEFPVNNVPSNQFTAWGKYSLPSGSLKGLSLNAGYRYIGRRSAGGIGALPALYLNSYDMFDAGFTYVRGNWSVTVLSRNIFDTYAFRLASSSSRLYPEEPRETSVTVSVKF